jgi:hypothetical protein
MRIAGALTVLALALGFPPVHAQSGQQALAPVSSGFLSDYSKLKPAPGREGIRSWMDRSVNYRAYEAIYFRPIEVVVTPGPDYKGIEPEVIKRMTDQFDGAFRRAVSPPYKLVDKPGPGVLVVRLAITGVQPVAPSSADDAVPIRTTFSAGRGKPVAEMSAEMEVLDASMKPVAAAVATRKGDRALPQADRVTWQHMEAIGNYWAKSFRERLDELSGVAVRK